MEEEARREAEAEEVVVAGSVRSPRSRSEGVNFASVSRKAVVQARTAPCYHLELIFLISYLEFQLYSRSCCPAIFVGSAPGSGANFWIRPLKTSAI